MVQPSHQAILRRLAEVCELSDDVRFGQLIDFLSVLAQDANGHSLAEIEDTDFLAAIDQHHLDLLRRREPAEKTA